MTNPNDPIFPLELGDSSLMNAIKPIGLTKREYFAAMAMQGFCSNPDGAKIDGKHVHVQTASIIVADALIAELNK